MARPRKDQQEPAAVERIKNAFWELLEENDLKHITVNMVTQKAHCNRGTFYYHYESLDALLCAVIEEELLNSKGLPLGIFYMLSNDSKALTEMLLPQRTQRFGLVMKRCGQECVALKIRTIIANMWQTILCDEEEELTTNARIIIEYSISGLIGVIDYLYREGKARRLFFPRGNDLRHQRQCPLPCHPHQQCPGDLAPRIRATRTSVFSYRKVSSMRESKAACRGFDHL